MRFSLSTFFKRNKAQPPVPASESFLTRCGAIIHLGANSGQERDLYRNLDLRVLWIEAIPAVFEQLKTNLVGYRCQDAVQALVADVAGQKRTLHVSTNEGLSSSLFELAGHKELWPEVGYEGEIELVTSTLDEIATRYWPGVRVDALVMDIQGAELLALQGAKNVLRKLRFIKAEASDFDAYAGACTVDALDAFLKQLGFCLRNKERFAGKHGVGNYYDVLWERVS